MNKKVLIIGCLLILCCCMSALGFGLLFGHVEFNNECSYKGPYANPTTGACATTNTNISDENDDQEASDDTSGYKVYSGDDYSFEYPSTFLVDDSDDDYLFVYATQNAHLNIAVNPDNINVSRNNCQALAELVIAALDPETLPQLGDVSTTKIGGYDTCRINSVAVYPDRGILSQRQYFIPFGTGTAIATINVPDDFDSVTFNSLDQVVRSMLF